MRVGGKDKGSKETRVHMNRRKEGRREKQEEQMRKGRNRGVEKSRE